MSARHKPEAPPGRARATPREARESRGSLDGRPPAVPYARGFPPVSSPDARVLVLGSLPGEKSIEMQQYYAQARNAFWPIMGELCGAGPALSYPRRLERLRAAGLALWDVLAAGERRGSLDSAIVPSSMVVNDFASFLAAHREIRFVAFNGSKAEELFRRRVLPTLPAERADLETTRLPSTSPANASYSFERKLALWSAALAGRFGSAACLPVSPTSRRARRKASRGRPGTAARRC